MLTSSISTSSAWVIDSCRRVLRSCKAQSDLAISERDRVSGAVWGVVWNVFEHPSSKSKPGPLIDLFVQLLRTFEPCEKSKLHEQIIRCLEPLVEGCSLSPQLLSECRRRLIPCLNEMSNDEKDRGVELEGIILEVWQYVSTMLTTKPSEEQSRPSKRLRIENTIPDPQEKAYSDKVRELTFRLTREHRSYLVGLRDTAL
jgi:hypothetical protein